MDQCIDQGMLYALITGGEPLLYPGFRELLERINKKPIHLALDTNGTLLNRETFDRIIELCNEYKALLQMVYYMFPPYRKDKGLIPNNARFTPEEAAEAALRIMKRKNSDPHMRRLQLEANCACFSEPERYSHYGKQEIACRGGYACFWVDWRGQISGCGVHVNEHIDLTKVPFSGAWKKIVASTESVRLSEKCQYCGYRCICPVCAAAAFCETGDVSGTPEYLCRFSEIYAGLLKEELERLRKDNV